MPKPKDPSEKDHTIPTKEEQEANIQASLKKIEDAPEDGEDEPKEPEENGSDGGNEPENHEEEDSGGSEGSEEEEPGGEEPEDEGGEEEEESGEDGEEGEEEGEDEEDNKKASAKKAKKKRLEDEKKRKEAEELKKKLQKPDYKKKFVASSREAQILHSKNKKMIQSIQDSANVPEPTTKELEVEYSSWDEMTDFEQKMGKSVLHANKRQEAIDKIAPEFKDIDAWTKTLDEFADDPQTLISIPGLEGKLEEFKEFATKQSRRGVDLADLSKAFLFEEGEKKPPKKKGKMFESGSGGPPPKPKDSNDGKLSVEASRKLRESNYDKYIDMLKNNKITLVE